MPGSFFMPATLLADRGALRVSGDEAVAFLQGLVTNDVESLAVGEARFAAILTPQGKILCDFFLVRPMQAPEEIWLDAPKDRLADLAQRLSLYRLRARVSIDSPLSGVEIAAAWPTAASLALPGEWFDDPRSPEAGRRGFIGASQIATDAEAYEAHRIALGLPKGGADFVYGDAFPHEADMDRLNGVSFHKGCYVGQEVVSRMQHRGTARNRVLRVGFAGAPPPAFAEIRAGETLLGRMGSAAGEQGLAMLRTDRLEEATAAGIAITAAGVELRLLPPAG
jgi:tRNA-modifying protein YgfZ